MATSAGIDSSLAANAGLDLGSGPLAAEALAKAMRGIPAFCTDASVYMGRKEWALRLAGKHPLYPPDDEVLIPAWQEHATAFWNRFDKRTP